MIVKKGGGLEWIPSFVRALPHREIGRRQVINHTSLSVTNFFAFFTLFIDFLILHTYLAYVQFYLIKVSPQCYNQYIHRLR